MKQKTIKTPYGWLSIKEDKGAICQVKTVAHELPSSDDSFLLQQLESELQQYFAGKRKDFTVPLAIEGSLFTQKILSVLQTIPYGQTLSYGQVAALAGSPKAARAVGRVCHRNSIMILIPCHRVVGAQGDLVGFAGGLAWKENLLHLEKNRNSTKER